MASVGEGGVGDGIVAVILVLCIRRNVLIGDLCLVYNVLCHARCGVV
jgi:hypothetical protein